MIVHSGRARHSVRATFACGMPRRARRGALPRLQYASRLGQSVPENAFRIHQGIL